MFDCRHCRRKPRDTWSRRSLPNVPGRAHARIHAPRCPRCRTRRSTRSVPAKNVNPPSQNTMSASMICEPIDHQYVVAMAEPFAAFRKRTRLIWSLVLVVWELEPAKVNRNAPACCSHGSRPHEPPLPPLVGQIQVGRIDVVRRLWLGPRRAAQGERSGTSRKDRCHCEPRQPTAGWTGGWRRLQCYPLPAATSRRITSSVRRFRERDWSCPASADPARAGGARISPGISFQEEGGPLTGGELNHIGDVECEPADGATRPRRRAPAPSRLSASR